MTAAKKSNASARLLARHWAALIFVLTVIVPIIFRAGRRPVIFSRWSGLGDIICTIPAALELKKRHPGATFLYNCHPDFAVIPKLAGIADRVTSLESIGLVGHWYKFLLAGFYHFAHGDDTPGQTSKESMVAEFCRQFGLPLMEEHPRLAIDPALLDKMRLRLKEKNLDPDSLIIIHPGPSWPVREWPSAKWTGLVEGLNRRGFNSIAQLGVGRYLNFCKVDMETIPGAVSLVNELSLEEAFAVIALAKLHIGIDSGLLHVAAAAGVPGVGIFGMTSPQFRFSRSYIKSFVVSRVECQGCYHRLPRVDWITNCPHDIRCMKTIEVDEVLAVCLAQFQTAAR